MYAVTYNLSIKSDKCILTLSMYIRMYQSMYKEERQAKTVTYSASLIFSVHVI